ncbi:hypothetical protein HYH03_017919 [Edaphochlamys debaryana]|uniref:Protein kinase domain-containing protein n=1 Tax=Edaphochlamys debaryana TaxID=47281 RepID=A0A835XN64_9CHLO|nr:hypothetical protein HYH03_017919 [Edaphochlamys debaryana]|eukprot:KAG2483184.1 hypothetical protein HYH03_017919 [Edaphochlamys debaryana]
MEPGGRVSSTRTRGPPLGLRRGLPRRAAPPLLLLLPLLLLGLLSACGVAGAVPEGPRAEAWADEQRSFLSKTRSAGSRGGLAQAAGPLLRGSQRQVLALVPPSEEQGPSGSRLLQGSSSTPGATGLDPAAIRAAPNSSSFFALLRDPRVTLILLPFDLTLRPEDATRQPILLNRNVTVWGGPQAAALAQAQAQALAGPSSAGAGRPPAAEADTPTPSPTAKGETGLGSSSLMDAVAAQLPPPGRENDTLVYVTLLSWEFLAARVKLASGVVLTLRDVLLYRVNSRLSAHLAFMAASGPGSVVRLERVVQQRVSCIPLDMALQAQRQKVPWNESLRLTPGLLPSLLPLPAPPGYTPGFQPAPGAPDLELFTGTLCAVTSPTTDDEPGAGQQQALTAAGASASTAVSPPPGVPAGQAVCRSPYLRVQDAAYAMQVLDSTLADNGGYRLVYNDSFVFCDFPVARACIDVQGPERCVTDELAKHQGSAGGPVSAAAGPGGQGSGAGGGGRAKQARQALGLGLGLGLGVPLLLVSALGLACLLLTGRRAPLTPPYVKPPLQSEPLEPGGLSTPMEVTEDSFTGSHRAPTAAVELAGAEGVLLRGASSSGLAAAEVKSGSGSQHSKGQGVLQQGPAQQQRRSLAQEAAEASGRLMQLETAGVEAVVRQLAASRREVSVQVLEPLGQGSFARVYKASWQGSIVALKVG